MTQRKNSLIVTAEDSRDHFSCLHKPTMYSCVVWAYVHIKYCMFMALITEKIDILF